jgi:hypothetical protein
MGDEATSRRRHGESVRQRDKWRHAYRQGCRRGYWLSNECRKVFDRPCAARRPTTVGGLQREANAIDTNKYVSIIKLTRVEMLLLIAQQHQAATAKSFVARQKTNDDRRAGAHAKTAKYKATSMN